MPKSGNFQTCLQDLKEKLHTSSWRSFFPLSKGTMNCDPSPLCKVCSLPVSHGPLSLRPGCFLGKGLGVWQEPLHWRCRGQASASHSSPPGLHWGVSPILPFVPSTGPNSSSSAGAGLEPGTWQPRAGSCCQVVGTESSKLGPAMVCALEFSAWFTNS